MTTQTSRGSRWRILALLLTVPIVVLAVGVSAVEMRRLVDPNADLFVPPTAYTFADAVAGGNDLMEVYQFIRSGQDPNALIAAGDSRFTNGRQVLVSPILWAVTSQRGDVVQMLVEFGARLDRPADRLSPCLADLLGNAGISELLRQQANAEARERCPAFSSEAPLLALLERAERPVP